jgi:hypothetical protein
VVRNQTNILNSQHIHRLQQISQHITYTAIGVQAVLCAG